MFVHKENSYIMHVQSQSRKVIQCQFTIVPVILHQFLHGHCKVNARVTGCLLCQRHVDAVKPWTVNYSKNVLGATISRWSHPDETERGMRLVSSKILCLFSYISDLKYRPKDNLSECTSILHKNFNSFSSWLY